MKQTKLKTIMFERGITQKRLSELSGVHKVTLSRVLHGHERPTLRIKRKIAKALGMSLTDVFEH